MKHSKLEGNDSVNSGGHNSFIENRSTIIRNRNFNANTYTPNERKESRIATGMQLINSSIEISESVAEQRQDMLSRNQLIMTSG
jgi:hypothetical protein